MPVLVGPGSGLTRDTSVKVKICGLTDAAGITAAATAGADYVGLVHFAKSPRHVDAARARELAIEAPVGIVKVLLTVNISDTALDDFMSQVPIDMIQLHGAETPERVAQVKARFGLPVMKAIGVADADDLGQIDTYADVADQLLIDAKPPKNATLPGGNGLAFDWRLIAGRQWNVPWMLAGGLDPANVAKAVEMTGTRQVDVSSGVESAPGMKDSAKIAAFVSQAKGMSK